MKYRKTSIELLDLMNEAIAREMQMSVQYLWQHIQCAGIMGFAVRDALRNIAIVEMKHAERIAERLVTLGGRPTTAPAPVAVGETLLEMIENDRKDEVGAIALYREIIDAARKEDDETTEGLFRLILADEEEHHGTFSGLLETL